MKPETPSKDIGGESSWETMKTWFLYLLFLIQNRKPNAIWRGTKKILLFFDLWWLIKWRKKNPHIQSKTYEKLPSNFLTLDEK